jgi:hypothetical protein
MTKNELEQLKNAHDYFATAVNLITTRTKYYHEEFQAVSNVVQFITVLRDDAKKKIEEIEPPVVKTKETYNMDLSHVKGEKPEVTTELT